jgi:Tol biopolymer transport system component
MCQETAAVCTASCGGDGPCVHYALQAELPVSLASLGTNTASVRGFTTSEAVAGQDLNGDGDMNDTAVTLRNRTTGVAQPLGAPGGCGVTGRSILQIQDPPHSYPAVAVENDVQAFLESETDSNRCVENADEDYGDAILRIVRLGLGETAYTSPLRAVDAAPVIGGQPLVVSNGKVFVRSSESAMAKRLTQRLSVGPGGVQAIGGGSANVDVSPDGRYVGFDDYASNLIAPGTDTNSRRDIFVRDRATGVNERVNLGPLGVQADQDSDLNAMSADGRFVVFTTFATNLWTGADANGVTDVFLRDRQTNTTERISVRPGNLATSEESTGGSISADGRYVGFESDSSGLIGAPFDLNGQPDAFVRDRQTGLNEIVSLGPADVQGNNFSGGTVLSADGRFAAFYSMANNLVAPGTDTNGLQDTFVRDRCVANGAAVPGCTAATTRITGPGGLEANGATFPTSISADGRYVVVLSSASNLLGPGLDTNGVQDVYVHDRETGVNQLVSAGPGGLQGNGNAFGGVISPEGRYVAFTSQATNLLGGGDGNANTDVFVHDRLTGTTERVNVGPGLVEGDMTAMGLDSTKECPWLSRRSRLA